MKIRIKGNSLRYRLSKSDVAVLSKRGLVQEKTEFGGQDLVYRLEIYNGKELSATFTGNTITLYVPAKSVKTFAESDQVGFGCQQGRLQLLLEKDFTCLENVAEDQSDNYPNPLANKPK